MGHPEVLEDGRHRLKAGLRWTATTAHAGRLHRIRIAAAGPGAVRRLNGTVYVPSAAEQGIVITEFFANPRCGPGRPGSIRFTARSGRPPMRASPGGSPRGTNLWNSPTWGPALWIWAAGPLRTPPGLGHGWIPAPQHPGCLRARRWSGMGDLWVHIHRSSRLWLFPRRLPDPPGPAPTAWGSTTPATPWCCAMRRGISSSASCTRRDRFPRRELWSAGRCRRANGARNRIWMAACWRPRDCRLLGRFGLPGGCPNPRTAG